MTKIKKISIKNFKAVSNQEADFNGCTAIITGGNNKGKSSFLRGIPDRIRGERPELIVKDGEKDGTGILELTTGEKFEWDFNSTGKDKLSFITKEGFKIAVTKSIAQKFFPPVFDIDLFLQGEPKTQSKMLQTLVGIDFAEINLRYKAAYEERTYLNKKLKEDELKLSSYGTTVEPVEYVDIANLTKEKETVRKALNDLYSENCKVNAESRNQWRIECDKLRSEYADFNNIQGKNEEKYQAAKNAQTSLEYLGFKNDKLTSFVEDLKNKILATKTFVTPSEPNYIKELPDDSELKSIDVKISDAIETNKRADAYLLYKAAVEIVYLSKQKTDNADLKVKSIEQEKAELISKAQLPTGLSFTQDGITVDGLPLDKNQLSTSKIYTTALRLASLNLGEVKMLYFDASTLDKNSLAEVEKWAKENGLQLLIERPDFEGGEIKYELINE